MDVRELAPGWANQLPTLMNRSGYLSAKSVLRIERDVVPSGTLVLEPFRVTNFQDVKVVVVGHGPYPTGYANGLAFGAHLGHFPPTLSNIFNEVERNLKETDGGWLDKSQTTLHGWANQGVLLLNSVLTTVPAQYDAHDHIGWEEFTDDICFMLMQRQKPIVFMLWGCKAREKMKRIVPPAGIENRKLVLVSSHPAPHCHDRGPLDERFSGCRHFIKANRHLADHGLTPIDWSRT